MNPDAYRRAMRLPRDATGGQELILGEIIAAVWPHTSVWVPFQLQGQALVDRLYETGHTVHGSSFYDDYTHTPAAEAVYFGTPTIVDGRALFPHREPWDVEKERRIVRQITAECEKLGYKRIVCGLGTGDIVVDDRLEDIGGGTVVAEKRFDEFTDWVIVRDLESI